MYSHPQPPAPPQPAGTVPADGWFLLAAAIVEGETDPSRRHAWQAWAANRRPIGPVDDSPPNPRRHGSAIGRMSPPDPALLADPRKARREMAAKTRRRQSAN